MAPQIVCAEYRERHFFVYAKNFLTLCCSPINLFWQAQEITPWPYSRNQWINIRIRWKSDHTLTCSCGFKHFNIIGIIINSMTEYLISPKRFKGFYGIRYHLYLDLSWRPITMIFNFLFKVSFYFTILFIQNSFK